MANLYLQIRKILHAHPLVARWASILSVAIPDLQITRRVDYLGPFSFGLRRQRWLLNPHALTGHAGILGQFAHLIDPDAVVYDVGANIGYYTCFMARNFPVRRIEAFEPMTGNLKLLRRNVALGPWLDRVHIQALALGDQDGEELLQIDDVGEGTAVLDRVTGGQPSEGRLVRGLRPKTQTVRVCRLDTLVREKQLPPPTFIKIDTEGAEGLVLAGARQTLGEHRPALAIALHGPEPTRQVLRLLEELGYCAFGYLTTGPGPRWQRLCLNHAEHLADNNILADADARRLSEPPPPLDFCRVTL